MLKMVKYYIRKAWCEAGTENLAGLEDEPWRDTLAEAVADLDTCDLPEIKGYDLHVFIMREKVYDDKFVTEIFSTVTP